MAFILSDRVKETTSTTGTGTYTLGGASTGFESFASIGNSNTTYYCCTNGTDFEVGIGTYTSSGTTLARTTILQSSNSDSAVNWSAGTKEIFCTLPAEKSVFKDASSNVTITSTATGGPILNLVSNDPTDANDFAVFTADAGTAGEGLKGLSPQEVRTAISAHASGGGSSLNFGAGSYRFFKRF